MLRIPFLLCALSLCGCYRSFEAPHEGSRVSDASISGDVGSEAWPCGIEEEPYEVHQPREAPRGCIPNPSEIVFTVEGTTVVAMGGVFPFADFTCLLDVSECTCTQATSDARFDVDFRKRRYTYREKPGESACIFELTPKR